MKTQIAVILPSRGLAFSETVDEVIQECKSVEKDYDWKIYWSHSRKVPDCLNVPTNEALRLKKNMFFWFVDDDMIITKGTLKHLLQQDRHAIMCDYPASITMGAILYDPDGRAFFGGNGCLLVKREVLEAIKHPVWRSDVGWRIQLLNDHVSFEANSQNPDKVYGQHDVHFGLRLYSQGKAIYVSKMTCGQRKLKVAGDYSSNKGAHEIIEWKKFHPNMMYIINDQGKRDESDMGTLVRIKMNDGEMLYTARSTAKKFIKKGLAKGVGHAIINGYDFEDEVKGDK